MKKNKLFRTLCLSFGIGVLTMTAPVQLGVMTEVSAEEAEHNVTFHFNIDAIDDMEISVKNEGRAAQPEIPENEGYGFSGWYLDEELTEKFVFSTKITEDTELYAKWQRVSVFEAEDLYLDELSGPGYSGAAYDYAMKVEDRFEAGASNGYFIGYLYARYDNAQYNTTLEFHITSDKDVSDVSLMLRLSAEYEDIVINGDDYEVLVNNEKIGYDNITFEGAADATSNSSLLPFEDYTISSSVQLKEGDNVIVLRTANDRKQGSGGTMNSTAPIVDCIKLAADNVNLSWTEGYSTAE